MAGCNLMKNALPYGSGSPGLHHSIKFWAYKRFLHPLLVLLLGCGTAEISEPVPPTLAAKRGEQNKLLFQLLQFARILSKVSAAKCDWTNSDLADRLKTLS